MACKREIKNLEDLLKGFLKSSEKVVGSVVSNLTAPGDNYGSIMLRILIKVKDIISGAERTIDAVGKTVPDSEATKEVFDTQVTFRNEYEYYALIIPTLDEFLKTQHFESGADFAAPFYGGRLNLDNSNQVDEDAIILMTNLKSAGYISGNKIEGLDYESTKAVLRTLAKLHASGLAFKLHNPKEFDKKIRPYFYKFQPSPDLVQMVCKNVIHTLGNSGFSLQEVDTVKSAFQGDNCKKNISDQWGTMTHYDIWTNNVLIKYDGSKPTHCILVDFQIFEYGTPLNDVMFFLFSSVQLRILEKNLDDILHYYYETFVGNLKKLGIDTQPFTYSSFEREVRSAAKNYEYFHAMWMLEPIMDEAFKSIDDLKTVLANDALLSWSEEHVQKIKVITRMCFDKGWL